MLIYVGDAPDGRQFVHVFVGEDSLTAMELTGGSMVDLRPILCALDTDRPVVMIVNLVQSEQETAEECAANLAHTGFPVRPPRVEAYFYGRKQPRVQDFAPVASKDLPPPPPESNLAKGDSAVCEDCGSRAALDIHGRCAVCEAIHSGLSATAPLSAEAESLAARIASHLVELRTLGVPVEITNDPDMLSNAVSVRCGSNMFERINL